MSVWVRESDGTRGKTNVHPVSVKTSARRRAHGFCAAFVIVATATVSGCSASDIDTRATPQGMTATAEILDQFDGYLSVGLKVENTSDTPLLFKADDDMVIDDAGGPDWSLPFGPRPASGKIDGYALEGEWPTELSPGAVATTAFLMDENYEKAVLTVSSINGGSITFFND
jgi:hypothetical protein